MKVAVYTCITDNYNVLKAPTVINSGVDYYCFHDGSIRVLEPWISLKLDLGLSSKDMNRFIKIKPHCIDILRPYGLTIYVDGSMEICSDLNQLISLVIKTKGDIFMYNHNVRNCVYDECKECYLSGKISLRAYSRMCSYLHGEGMEKNFGLFEAGVILRKSQTVGSIAMMNSWWDNYINSFNVKRDQISFVYTLWQHGMTVIELGLPDFYGAQYNFRIHHHRHSHFSQRLFSWYILRPARVALLKIFGLVRFVG